MDPRNILILWFTAMNWNPVFRFWWELADVLDKSRNK